MDALASATDPLNDLVLEHDFHSCGRRTLRVSGRRFAGQPPASPMILLAIEDATVSTDAKRQLVSAMERAENANRAKSDFLANMSHEIRTPLTAILGFADLLTARDPATADPDHPLAKIRRNARQLTELINDILDLSKVEAGRLDVDVAPFPLMPLLVEELATLRDRARAKGLAFEVRFDGPVPETVSSCRTRLRQILLNVVGNAIKFTDSGTVGVAVTLLAARGATGRKLGFVVRDTGCGITAEQQSNLFQVFGQADGSVARRYGGSGLGLNLSRRLAQALGGDVVLTESRPGRGSTFTITIDPGDLEGVRMLSGLEGEALLNRLETRARPVATSSGVADGLRVLLAEDNPDNRELISLFLETSGAEVEFAVNGEEAVRMAAEGPHDVILMDIQMPVVDGYEATRRIRQSGNRTPIVALTAHAMSGEKERCRAAGCDDYLSKPIDFASLVDMVARYGRRGAGTSEPRSG